MNLPLYSAGFCALSLVLYVVLDGFDLGVGTLLFFERAPASRDHMIDSITPTWDGNETWLIMAGVTLLAGFPIAYGILLPALYLPVIIMLLALGLRGVSFEFRAQMKSRRQQWDRVFAVGSLTAAFMQGMVLGSLLEGVRTEGVRFTGSVEDVMRVLPLLSGLTLACGYVVLGAGWLYLKANRAMEQFAVRAIRIGSICFAALFCICCYSATRIQPNVSRAWSTHPVSLPILAGMFLVLSVCLVVLRNTWSILPFLLAITQFFTGMVGLAVILFPNIVPFQVSLWEAAASPTSQKLLLIGAGVVSPVVIAYSAFAYWVFRGRTPSGGWEL
jgi:cytochrome bd ubiquinol oxidase subunit II